MTATRTTTSANFSHHLLILLCCIMRVVAGIKIVDILIPDKAIVHSRVRLSCRLDLEEDTLYSMKWHLNGSEVVSFMPQRNHSLQLFATREMPITIESEAAATDLLIQDVTWSCEGTWSCEVFADHSFQKDKKVVHMIVIAPPTESPILQSSKDSYDISEFVNVTCIAPPAKPLPRLTWLINGESAPMEYVFAFENATGSQLVFPLQVQYLFDGKPRVQITCEASYNYSQSSYGNARSLLVFDGCLMANALVPETMETTEIKLGSNGNSSSSFGNSVRIFGLQSGYAVGDELKLTCSYRGDEEEVVMHWLVNHQRVRPRLVIRYRYHNYIGLRMRIEKRDLNHRNQISIRCLVSRFTFRVRRNVTTSSSAAPAAGDDRLMISFMTHLWIAGVMFLNI